MGKPAKKWLIVDIDGTIADTDARKYASADEVIPGIDKNRLSWHGIGGVFNKEEKEKFYSVFLSEKYLHLDEPMDGAPEALQELSGSYNIAYVTSRHDAEGDSMKEGTLRWLEGNGFPVPDGKGVKLYMKPVRRMGPKAYKSSVLKKVQNVAAGVGDAITDYEAYSESGIMALILESPETSREVEEMGIKTVKDWKEIKETLLKRHGGAAAGN